MLLTVYASSTRDFINTVAIHRRLLRALAKRELSDEYVSHTLSVSWAVIHPLFLMLVYLFVFTLIFPSKVKSPPNFATDPVVYLLAGIIPWLALSQVMGRSPGSIANNLSIVKQMNFPLELLPIKALTAPLVFSGISLVFLIAYGGLITGGSILPIYMIGMPILIILSIVLFAGLSLILGTVQVFIRDVKEIVSMFLTAGFFLHPILYFPDAMPAAVRPIIYLSPFSYFIFCWQDIMFFGGIVRPWAWVVTLIFSFAIFALGARLFLVSKTHFGDFL